MSSPRRVQGGFTLIELMITVAILGVLSSVAIPSFIKNIRKAKTAEPPTVLRRMYEASRTYMMDARVAKGSSTTIALQFPEPAATTPAVSCCLSVGHKCAPNPALWDDASWQALQFAMVDPHYYRYEYASTGSANSGTASSFTARAYGDLDCDTTYSTYEMSGHLSSAHRDVVGNSSVFADKALE